MTSCGTPKITIKEMYEKGVDKLLTKKQQEVLRLRNEGKTFQFIADKMNISKQAVNNLERKAFKKVGGLTKSKNISKRGLTKKQGGLTKKGLTTKHFVSLHNDSITFQAKCRLQELPYEKKVLKYTYYRLYKDDNFVIKFFKEKIVVQFRNDIICPTSEECQAKARQRIKSFISSFHTDGVSFDRKSFKQIARHFAILGTDLAKKYVREGKKFLVLDEWDGKERLIIDFSDKDKKNGMPHFEATHPDKSYDDSNVCEKYFDDIINNPHYLPSQQKNMFDIVMSVQKEYAYQIKKHLEVQEETLKTLKEIQNSVKSKNGMV